jgi:hypothetical protein
MSTRDEHLKKALQHAPDSDVAPRDATRKAVLDYADKALKLGHKTHRESWFSRLINAFNSWKIPNWQLTGMGSLAASLLVIVMVFHENPNDPIQVASAPDTVQSEAMKSEAGPSSTASSATIAEPKLAQNEAVNGELARDRLAKDSAEASQQAAAPAIAPAPEAASAEIEAPKLKEKTLNHLEAKIEADNQSAKQAAAPQASRIEAPAEKETPADKANVASAPEAASVETEKDAAIPRAKGRVAKDEVVMASPAPVAPAMVEAAPASAQSAPVQMKKMADAEAQASAKADAGASTSNNATEEKRRQVTKPIIKPITKRIGDDSLAKTIVQMGGAAMAKQDIQADKLRILEVAEYYKGKPSDCQDSFMPSTERRVDAQTAYNIEEIYVCVANQQLTKEVALYNQVMREWHLENGI